MCVKRQKKNYNHFAFLRDETSWTIFHCADSRARKSKQNAFWMDVSGGDASVH